MFEGHFPGYPIMPGVLMIETMAQTGGWLVLAAIGCAKMPFLMQVEKAKMRAFVAPGQALEVEATLLHDGSGYAVVKASIAVGREESGGSRNPLRRRAVPERSAAGRRCWKPPAASGCPRNFSMAHERDALITGIGIVSCLGSGADAHWAALNEFHAGGGHRQFPAVRGASDGAAGSGQADPQARRPAADGAWQRIGRVRRRSGARFGRGRRATPNCCRGWA